MKIVTWILAALLSAASFWGFRLAYAEWLYQHGKVEQAAGLMPLNAEYQMRLGNLKRALELNPYLTNARIEMGLEAEAEGRLAEAEQILLHAAEFDRMFEPRWTLANFYFRLGKGEEFWKWLRLAGERSYGDRRAIFRLGLRMGDERTVQERVIGEELSAAYVEFLLEEGKLRAAHEAAAGVVGRGQGEDLKLLLTLVERLLTAGMAEEARVFWNAMIDKKLLAYAKLDGAQGPWLTNEELTREPLGKGFDWRLLWRNGVYTVWARGQRQIRCTLSGKQQEKTDLVAQLVAVQQGVDYTLRYRYRTEGLVKQSGVRWQVEDAISSKTVETRGAMLSSEQWKEDAVGFRSSSGLMRIALVYQRATGTSRQEGTILLDGAFDLGRSRIE